MNNIDHHTRFYRLLPSFLKDAEKLGFIRTPRQWSVIYHMLENVDDTSRLKYSLSPVLCTSPDQQAEFYKLYDHWFIELAVGLQEEENTASSSDSANPSATERKPDTGKHPIVPFGSNVNDQKNGLQWWQWLLVFVPLSIPAIATVRMLGWSNPFTIIALVFLFLSSIWVIRRWKNRKLVVRQERTDRGDTFWNFHVPPHRLIAFGPEFKRLSTRLRERVPGKVSRLNIRNTVRKTALANGFLSLQFRVNTEIPSCLMLIDLSNDNNHRAALFDAFYFWLKDNDVPVVRFYFRSVPNLLWNEDIPKGIPLTTLAASYAESRLFLLGDGWRLLHAETGEPNASAQVFRSWNDRVLITPIPFPQWTGRERSLESLFVIAPFTADGLKIIEKHLNPEEPFDWELQRPDYWHEEAILFEEAALPDSLYTHFSDPAIREWLAALSFYPELNWNLTLFLGDLIGKMNGRSLLTFENLRQLSRIYWFYNGFIPTQARESLYKILKDQKEKTQIIHGRIAEILEEQLKHKEEYYSADRNSLYLQILLHKAHAGAASRTEIKELRQLAKETKEDFLIARYTNKPKPWEWVLPQEFAFLLPKGEEMNAWWRNFSNSLAKMKEGIIPGFENAEHYIEDETKEVAKIQPERDVNQSIDNIKDTAADTIWPSDEDILNSRPLKVFIVYARADAKMKDRLLRHLTPLKHMGLIETWSDSNILPGEEWEKRIMEELHASDLIILLVSSNALNSEYILKKEFQIVFEKSLRGEVRVVPVLVDSCNWSSFSELARLQFLPINEHQRLQPVNQWADSDIAWTSIASDILELTQEIRVSQLIRIQKVKENIEKNEKARHRRDEATWKKVFAEAEKADDPEHKIISFETYLADAEHLNHREEAEEQIEELKAEISATRKLEAARKSSADRLKGLPEMVLVKGGTFQMGDKDIATPVHSVTLSDFEIGKYPVTQKLWSDIMGNNPSNFKGDDLPVEQVNWDDCHEFLKKLNQKTGKKYRLPTEAEWEFAARGGTFSKGFQYAGSNDLNEVGWYWENSGDKKLSGEWKSELITKNKCRTHPIGLKKANELSLYDMSGNIWEWCADWYEQYPSGTQTNPTGPASGSNRVLRGGSWGNDALLCRVAHRFLNAPVRRISGIGFRLVSSPR